MQLEHGTLSLWMEPGLLAARLCSRVSGFTEWEPSRILNEEVRSNRYPKERMLDVTALSPEAVLAVAMTLVPSTAGGWAR